MAVIHQWVTRMSVAVPASFVLAMASPMAVTPVDLAAVPVIVIPMTVVALVTTMTARWRAPAWGRLLHKVHRLAAGVVAGAVLAPVLGMAGRHIQINR